MKPFSIVLSINLSLLAIWALVFIWVVNRPEYIPLFIGFQTALNLLGAGVFYLDRKKQIMVAFLIGALMCGVLAGAGFGLMQKYKHLIRIEEGFTA